MLFEELDKVKRNAVMAAIVLAAAGFVLMVVPYGYLGFLSDACGFALLVAFVLSALKFIDGGRALMSYLRLTGGIAAGLLGLSLLVFDGLFAAALQWLVGTVPILLGAYGIYHALAYARKSGRRGWWVLVVLSASLFAFGGFVFCNPWMGSPEGSIQIVGGTLLYSAVVSGLSLVWIWPVRDR